MVGITRQHYRDEIPLPDTFALPVASSRTVGAVCAVATVALWIWVRRGPDEVRFRQVAVRMPSERIFPVDIPLPKMMRPAKKPKPELLRA